MEKRHRCKLCNRNFANGRALGGHMRSHMMKFYEAKKRQQDDDDDGYLQSLRSYSSTSISPSPSSSSSSSSDDDEDEEEVKLVDHDFYVTLQDRESETEFDQIRTRSKRVAKSTVSDLNGYFQAKKKSKLEGGKSNTNNYNDYSSLSSISDTTPDEHVAHCLIMLSRDKWRRAEVEFQRKDEEDDDGKGENDNSEDYGVAKVIKTKVRGKYRCETCNKLFRSYQALGGHRASHKKVKVAAEAVPSSSGGRAVEVKLHECPFCHRVFSSGQALGGHKRSHFVGSGAVSANAGNTSPVKQSSRNCEVLNIDLNLPAPVDDEENSQVADSTVSDAEFVHPIKHW